MEKYIWIKFKLFFSFKFQRAKKSGEHTQNKDKDRRKAKVVASVWGTEFIQFYAMLVAICAQDDFEKKDEFILFFQIILVQLIL